MQICPLCGEEMPDRFRVCGMCGTQLGAAPAAVHVRRTVTVVFCDLKGSTELGERLDPELVREVLNRYFAEMRAVLERHGATVESYLGDAIMAVFGLPRLHEDDALRAVRAAREMQSVLDRLNDDLEERWGVRLANRVGINTGEVIAGAVGEQRLVTGDTVNVAARLESAAGPMETLIGLATYRLVRAAVKVEEVEPLTLKGKAEPVPAFRLLDVMEIAQSRRLDTPLVGRAAELLALENAFAKASTSAVPQVSILLGDAGTGKTRLVSEFLERNAESAQVLRGHCLAYGDGITFWPLGEVVRQAAAIGEEDPTVVATAKLQALAGPEVGDRLAAAIGLSSETFAKTDIFWAARKLFEQLSRERPLVVLFDDIHWAEQTFLELIEHVAANATDARLVLLCSARHELDEQRPEWLAELPNRTRLALQPLSSADCALIIEHLLGRAGLPAEIQQKILDTAEGNPLFVEQMVSILVDDGLLVYDGEGGWKAVAEAAGQVVVPPSITALLSARLDRLERDERAVAEAGSVVGVTFQARAVETLCPDQIRPRVPDRLDALGRKLLIRRVDSVPAREEEYRFQHSLVRDAAYEGLLKRARAEMHAKLADWLEGTSGLRALEMEEIVGYHLEQANRYLAELGPLDAAGQAMGLRAGRLLGSAGRRALARGDAPAAADLLRRATTVLPKADPDRLSLVAALGEALIELGQFESGDTVLGEATETAAGAGEHGLEAYLRVVHLRLRYLTDPEQWGEPALRQCQDAITVLESLQHDAGLHAAWWLVGTLHGHAGRLALAQQAIDKAIQHAIKAGDRRQRTRCCTGLAICELDGPTPVPVAIARCEQLLEDAEGDFRAQAWVSGCLARLYAMQGSFDRARELYGRGRQTLRELGDALLEAMMSLYSGGVELLAGDPVAAERELRPDYDKLAALGERVGLSSVAVLLSRALYEQGRFEDADVYCRAAEQAASADDSESQVGWRQVRGLLQLRSGDAGAAVATLIAAVDLARESESPAFLASALADLVTALEGAGLEREAATAREESIALYRAKGDLVSVRAAARVPR